RRDDAGRDRAAEAERVADREHPVADPRLGRVAQFAAGSGVLTSTLSRARSVTESRPITWACNVVSSDRVTVICSALAITWLLVTISPAGSMMKPEPSEAVRGAPDPPVSPFSPKKSRKNSSSEDPGDACGTSCAVLAGGVAIWVEMLT